MQIFGKNELHVRLETLRGEMEEIEISSYKGRWGLTMGGWGNKTRTDKERTNRIDKFKRGSWSKKTNFGYIADSDNFALMIFYCKFLLPGKGTTSEKNYRKVFFLCLLSSFLSSPVRRVSFDLFNHYFLTAPGKCEKRWGGKEFTWGSKKIFVRFAREKNYRPK